MYTQTIVIARSGATKQSLVRKRLKIASLKKEGFTLFELLIAMVIGTVLIMAGTYAIRIGLFSMERGETWFNESTKEKAAYDFFWQQTSALHIQNVQHKNAMETEGIKKSKKKKTIYFLGDNDFLTFVSPLSFARHYGQGFVIANYKVKINDKGLWDLIYAELRVNSAVLIKLSEESESRLSADKDYTVFLRDCDKISFSYLGTVAEKEDNEGDVDGEEEKTADKKGDLLSKIQSADVIEGTDLQWKEKTKEKVPLAIKLLVSKYGKEQELISPIMVMY
ncbi:MAG: prepilin-type N-terminal cleavage/methylation domain-containing protein [Planctomycetia bacterium]|nr:prepilin-type N-terminal cleavage/methylation domain-containing protein [Planctomycetia bacterium]